MKSLFAFVCFVGAIFFVATGGKAMFYENAPQAGAAIIGVGALLFGVAALLSKSKSGGKKSAGPLPW